MRNLLTRAALLLAALTLVAAGCGDDDGSGPSASGDPATPTTTAATDAGDGSAPADAEAPARIVSLSPTATEILFALGAGSRVVAVDDQSTYPPEAPVTDLSGFDPNVEAIASYEPDLVVLSFDPGDLQPGLEALDIEVVLQPPAATLDDAWAQIEQLGAATGSVAEAAELVAALQADLEDLVAGLPERDEPLTYFFEVDQNLYSATSNTFVGELLGLAGLRSIADAADDGSGFPQLSAEYVIDADPDLILLADTGAGGQTAESIAARPGWDQLTAVREGRVVELDPDLASRWGPRIVDLLASVVEAVEAIGEPAGASAG